MYLFQNHVYTDTLNSMPATYSCTIMYFKGKSILNNNYLQLLCIILYACTLEHTQLTA